MASSRWYSITIHNQSGSKQSYALFAAAPGVTPAVKNIHTNIITRCPGVASGVGQARVVLTKQLFALCGISSHIDIPTADGTGDEGTGTEIIDKRQVTLGVTSDDGSLKYGSEWDVIVSDGSPSFPAEGPTAKATGVEGAFCMKTGNDFTVHEARREKYILGVGGSLNDNFGPYAIFVPQPNTTYQIKPSKVFFVIVGNFGTGMPVGADLKDSSATCKIDFTDTDDVLIVHDQKGLVHVISMPDE